MKRIFLAMAAILVAIAFSSCDEINLLDSEVCTDYVLTSIDAKFEGMQYETKTTTDGSKVEWLAGDAINVFFGASESSKFTTETSGEIAQFKGSIGVVTGGGEGLKNDTSLWGVYPYNSKTTCDGTSVTYTLPSVQYAKAGSFADDLFPTLARSQNFVMSFYNICGGWCFMVSNPDIVKVTLKGNNGEKIAGKAKITMDRRPIVSEILDGTTELTMYAPGGGCFETGKYYYFVLYPTEFSEGLTITYHKADSQASYTVNKSVTTTRSIFNYLTNRDQGLVFEKLDDNFGEAEEDYIDEYGINHGVGVDIDGVVWAPVNCGYHKTDYPYGKLYQWGRKYGQGYSGELYINGTKNGTYSDAIVPELVDDRVTIEIGQSNSNSNKFYYHNSTPYDWTTERSDELWNSGTEESPIKSEYDPCPSGWRIPTYAELYGLIKNKSKMDSNTDGQNGLWFSGSNVNPSSAQQVFLQTAGYRLGSSGEAVYRGDTGIYWTSWIYNNNGYGYVFYGNNQYFVDIDRSMGASVRCVREAQQSIPSNPPDQDAVNISIEGTANCYIVSESGRYKFMPTKGNSLEPVGEVASVGVLWETLGTYSMPNVGDLINDVTYLDGMINFTISEPFKEGNAVIAAKDSNGDILWSWHIWLTDYPEEQMYYNNAGVLMDRNLGAYDVWDIGSYGLMYQWGRKDPFLPSLKSGGYSFEHKVYEQVYSTGEWSTVESDEDTGTIEYSIKNPTTFIKYNEDAFPNHDWYYADNGIIDNTRWNSSKTIYDPCPVGWRVPDGGGEDGVWAKAYNVQSTIDNPICEFSYNNFYENGYDRGMSFKGTFGSGDIWYLCQGNKTSGKTVTDCGFRGWYWSCTPTPNTSLYLSDSGMSYYFACSINHVEYDSYGILTLAPALYRYLGFAVRCLKE